MISKKVEQIDNPLLTIAAGVEHFKQHMEKLRNGYVPGILTPYPNLNDAMINGIPKNGIHVIAGHSGTGKTLLANNIAKAAPMLNKDTVVLVFTLEMPVKDLVARNISDIEKVSVKELYLNPELNIESEELNKLKELPIYYYEFGGEPEEIFNLVYWFCKSKIAQNKDVLLIIDHSLLVEGNDDGEKLGELAIRLNTLKKQFKSIETSGCCLTTLILSQLNDGMMSKDRVMKKTLMHPLYTDLYQGRKLFHICDVVIALNIPNRYLDNKGDTAYGDLPVMFNKGGESYEILYAHIIKGRSCGTSIVSFVNAADINKLYPIINNKMIK
jgi:archaellum biogenesis ATPase FlaH